MSPSFESWLRPMPSGLYCVPGEFFIDPHRAVDRAIITHGHSDHARPGHAHVLASPQTLAIMRARLGAAAGGTLEGLAFGERRVHNGVAIQLAPAGHVLGSAQVVLEWCGMRAVVTGDYKRHHDPTAAPFELVRTHLLVTEATFGLPVFRHEPAEREIGRLLRSLAANPDRAHLVGAYGLGKCQRLIALLREAGYERPIRVHGASARMCELYEAFGITLGPLARVEGEAAGGFAGEIVLAPPSALADRWSRRLADPVTCFASGWMRVRGRARQRGVELPLVISDHADWPELVRTIAESGAQEIWVTHGREEALCHQAASMGLRARALTLVGRGEEDGDGPGDDPGDNAPDGAPSEPHPSGPTP